MVPTTTIGYVDVRNIDFGNNDLLAGFTEFCKIGALLEHPAATRALGILTFHKENLPDPFTWSSISRIYSLALLLCATDQPRDPVAHDFSAEAMLAGMGSVITIDKNNLKMCCGKYSFAWVTMRRRGKAGWRITVEADPCNIAIIARLREGYGPEMVFPELPPAKPTEFVETMH